MQVFNLSGPNAYAKQNNKNCVTQREINVTNNR